MDIAKSLHKFIGGWQGINLMRLTPDREYGKSDSQANIAIVAQSNAAIVTYTWAEGGKPQDGVLLITNGHQPDSVAAIWVDSWHQYPQWMELQGEISNKESIRLEGKYTSEGMDCGWRIHLHFENDQFRITMDNMYGDLDYQAVEATYSKTALRN